jgi:hypothetical protein
VIVRETARCRLCVDLVVVVVVDMDFDGDGDGNGDVANER